MLTIHINKNASGLVSYFTKSLSKDDYFFSSGKSVPGRWHGALVDDLGLPDKVNQKDFSRLAHNRHPKTGEKLTVRNLKERRTSIEYTFSAPKSVSLIMALSDHEDGKAILNAHRRSVRKAMEAIEADMQTQTRVQGLKTYMTTGEIVYARFLHFTSRPVKEEIAGKAKILSDPNLHSHCVVMNCTKFDGRYQAIEASTTFSVSDYYKALYHSHLSKSLSDLGYQIARTKNNWEISSPGLTRRTLEKFSRRTTEIEKLASELKITNPKKKAALGAKTRLNKSMTNEDIDLKAEWLDRLTAIERSAIHQARYLDQKSIDTITPELAIERALEHHLERRSTVAVKKLLGHALSLGYGELTQEQVVKALQSRANVLYARKGHLDYLTTKEMVRAEDRMIEFAANGKNTVPPLNPNYHIQRAFLNEQQRDAIHHILNSKDRVSILSGAAGVGKSTLLVEVKEALEQKGRTIIALAPSSGASRVVLRQKGFKDADTIAAFLKNKELQKQAYGQTILVDEASLVGVKTMNRIFETARKLNARVILSGDVRQHSSPERGDALRLLQEKSKLKVANVDQNLRQRNSPAYKKAIDLIAEGRTREGFERLHKMGAIIEIEDVDKRHGQIAHDFLKSLEAKRSALVISPTHAEGNIITEVIREKMKERGRIEKQDKAYTVQKSLSYTEAEKKNRAMYEPGMIVQFHQNVKGGFKAGQKYEVVSKSKYGFILVKKTGGTKISKLPLNAPDHYQVFEKAQIKLSKGDSIRITQNGKTKEDTRIYNGQTFSVRDFLKGGHILLSNGKMLDRDYANITYAYAQTSHAVQGKDCQDVFIAQSAMSFPASNEKQFYVSTSRAKETIKIYTDDKQALKGAISKSGERMSAGEIADGHYQQQRKRQRYYEFMINKEQYGRSKEHNKDKLQEPVWGRG